MAVHELENFLPAAECTRYIEQIDGAETCVPFTDTGKFLNNKWTDAELAQVFYEKLKTYGISGFLRPNTVIMSGKYVPGDSFSLHTDTGLYYNKDAGEKSRWTLLIYLNDDFDGGETVFYDDNWRVTKSITPKKGHAVLFDIDLWHKGSPVTRGAKYWIGCEIIDKTTARINPNE